MNDLAHLEFSSNINEAWARKDWRTIEHWAGLWVASPAKSAEAFLWLARACLVLEKIERARYAYKRLEDFEPEHKEAQQFFAEYPEGSEALPEKPKREEFQEQSEPWKGNNSGLAATTREKLSKLEAQLARAYAEANLFAEASDYYMRSFEWKENEEAALEGARCFHRAGQSHRAQKFLRDQLLRYKDWHKGRLLLGRICLELGQRQAAQREWQNILKSDPTHKEALHSIKDLLVNAT